MMMYHVVFDDDFTTVQRLRTEERPPFLEKLVRDNTKNFGIVDPTKRPRKKLDWSNLDWFGEGAPKALAKKRQMDEVPEGDPFEGPTSILNGKTHRQQVARKVKNARRSKQALADVPIYRSRKTRGLPPQLQLKLSTPRNATRRKKPRILSTIIIPAQQPKIFSETSLHSFSHASSHTSHKKVPHKRLRG